MLNSPDTNIIIVLSTVYNQKMSPIQFNNLINIFNIYTIIGLINKSYKYDQIISQYTTLSYSNFPLSFIINIFNNGLLPNADTSLTLKQYNMLATSSFTIRQITNFMNNGLNILSNCTISPLQYDNLKLKFNDLTIVKLMNAGLNNNTIIPSNITQLTLTNTKLDYTTILLLINNNMIASLNLLLSNQLLTDSQIAYLVTNNYTDDALLSLLSDTNTATISSSLNTFTKLSNSIASNTINFSQFTALKNVGFNSQDISILMNMGLTNNLYYTDNKVITQEQFNRLISNNFTIKEIINFLNLGLYKDANLSLSYTNYQTLLNTNKFADSQIVNLMNAGLDNNANFTILPNTYSSLVNIGSTNNGIVNCMNNGYTNDQFNELLTRKFLLTDVSLNLLRLGYSDNDVFKLINGGLNVSNFNTTYNLYQNMISNKFPINIIANLFNNSTKINSLFDSTITYAQYQVMNQNGLTDSKIIELMNYGLNSNANVTNVKLPLTNDEINLIINTINKSFPNNRISTTGITLQNYSSSVQTLITISNNNLNNIQQASIFKGYLGSNIFLATYMNVNVNKISYDLSSNTTIIPSSISSSPNYSQLNKNGFPLEIITNLLNNSTKFNSSITNSSFTYTQYQKLNQNGINDSEIISMINKGLNSNANVKYVKLPNLIQESIQPIIKDNDKIPICKDNLPAIQQAPGNGGIGDWSKMVAYMNAYTAGQIDYIENSDTTKTKLEPDQQDVLDKSSNLSQFTVDTLCNLGYTFDQICYLNNNGLNQQINITNPLTCIQCRSLVGLGFNYSFIATLINNNFTSKQVNTLINNGLSVTIPINNISFSDKSTLINNGLSSSDKLLDKTYGEITIGEIFQNCYNFSYAINTITGNQYQSLIDTGYPDSVIISLMNNGLTQALNTDSLLSYSNYKNFIEANISDSQIASMLNLGLNQNLSVLTEILPSTYTGTVFTNIYNILNNNTLKLQQLMYMLLNGYTLTNILNWTSLTITTKLSNTISRNLITKNQYDLLRILSYPIPSSSSALMILMNNGLSNTIAFNTITYANYLYLTTTLTNTNIICSIDTLVKLMNGGLTSNASILSDSKLTTTNIIDSKINSIMSSLQLSYQQIANLLNIGYTLDFIQNTLNLSNGMTNEISSYDNITFIQYSALKNFLTNSQIISLMINGLTNNILANSSSFTPEIIASLLNDVFFQFGIIVPLDNPTTCNKILPSTMVDILSKNNYSDFSGILTLIQNLKFTYVIYNIDFYNNDGYFVYNNDAIYYKLLNEGISLLNIYTIISDTKIVSNSSNNYPIFNDGITPGASNYGYPNSHYNTYTKNNFNKLCYDVYYPGQTSGNRYKVYKYTNDLAIYTYQNGQFYLTKYIDGETGEIMFPYNNNIKITFVTGDVDFSSIDTSTSYTTLKNNNFRNISPCAYDVYITKNPNPPIRQSKKNRSLNAFKKAIHYNQIVDFRNKCENAIMKIETTILTELGVPKSTIRKLENTQLMFMNLDYKKIGYYVQEIVNYAACFDPTGLVGLALAIEALVQASEDYESSSKPVDQTTLLGLIFSVIGVVMALGNIVLTCTDPAAGVAKSQARKIIEKVIMPLLGSGMSIGPAIASYVADPSSINRQALIDACIQSGIGVAIPNSEMKKLKKPTSDKSLKKMNDIHAIASKSSSTESCVRLVIIKS